MIFEEHKAVHVHIVKTAGTSIRHALGYTKDDLPEQHYDVWKYLKELRKKGRDPKDYFKFTFVRNPYDRCLSLYLFWRDFDVKPKNYTGTFEEFLREASFLPHTRNQLDMIAEPVWKWDQKAFQYVEKPEGVNLLVDFVGRFENLYEDMNTVFDRIGVGKKALPHLLHLSKGDYREYYTRETKRLVELKSERDFQYFGYRFD